MNGEHCTNPDACTPGFGCDGCGFDKTTQEVMGMHATKKQEAPGYIRPKINVEIINPDEIFDTVYVLHFQHGTYGVVAQTEADALEEFGLYALKNAPGYLLGDFTGSKTHAEMKRASVIAYLEMLDERGEDIADESTFGVNGGEYYLNELPGKIDRHEYTKLERVAHCCKNGAMVPVIHGPSDVFEVEDENGDTYFRQVEYGFDDVPEKDGGVMTVTRHNDVYLAYLSMPGYLDRTDASMFDNIDDACEELIRMYGNS